MAQTHQMVENQDSSSNADATEVKNHQHSGYGAGDAAATSEADKRDKETGSGRARSISPPPGPDPFGLVRNGTIARVEESCVELSSIKRNFVSGMGFAGGRTTTVVEVHKYPDSNLTRRARFEAFRAFLAETVRKCEGNVQNAHIRSALYSGSRAEIARILEHGFSAVDAKGGGGLVRLVPAAYSLDAALSCEVDEAGVRHVVLCRVIMGKKVQLVPCGSNHIEPDFDSSCDSLDRARRLYVPASAASSRICADLVISFEAPRHLEVYATYATEASGALGPRYTNNWRAFLERLLGFVPSEQMATVVELIRVYREENKMCQGQLIDKVRAAIGDEAFAAAVKPPAPASAEK